MPQIDNNLTFNQTKIKYILSKIFFKIKAKEYRKKSRGNSDY